MPPNHNHPPTIKALVRPRNFYTNPYLFVFTWTIAITLFPFIFLFLSALYVYREVIRLVARKYANLTHPLTPYDCIFAVDSYYTRPFASNLTVLELSSRIDVGSLRNLFKTRILDDEAFKKLYCSPVEYLGYWFWRRLDTEPDLNECVKVYYDSELEHGKSKSVDECLREIIEMPFRNELFNVMLLHFGKRSVIVFRIHHTVCDGYSFNKLIDKFVGLESKYLVKEKKIEGGWIGKVKEVVFEWGRIAHLIFYLPLHISQLYREHLTHTPNYYTLPKTSTTGMIRTTILPLSQMKYIRSTSNSHFAALGMSLMTGALQKFYDSSPHPPHLRPDKLCIMHSLPRPNHPLNSTNVKVEREMCNWWGVGLFKVPFMKNAVARLFGAEEDFNEYMDLQYHNVLHIHFPIVSLIPCWVVKWFFSINFGTSCGFTSVPGLFDKVAYVGGMGSGVDHVDGGVIESPTGPVEVLHMWKSFGLQWKNSAVAVAMYTYRGEASVSIYANKGDIIPDDRSMDKLLGFFHDEFNELATYANNGDLKQKPLKMFENRKPNGPLIDTKFLDTCFRNNKLA